MRYLISDPRKAALPAGWFVDDTPEVFATVEDVEELEALIRASRETWEQTDPE